MTASNSTIRAKRFSDLVAFGRMIKIAHSIFALPFAAVAVMIALHREIASISPLDVVLLIVCMVSARTAAMGFNRIVDRDIDAENPRTRGRELPSGAISVGRASALTGIASAIFIAASFGINPLCGLLSLPVLLLLLGYSLVKRYTWGVHFVLGLCLGAAPLGVWFALTASFDPSILLLALGITLWTAGFDIYYSLQDEQFDRQRRLGSVPARFGRMRSIGIVRLVHLLALAGFAGFGIVAGLGLFFWVGFSVVAGILGYEAWLLRRGNISKIDVAFFTANGYVSILFALAVGADLWLRI